jgi:hypothetical protein
LALLKICIFTGGIGYNILGIKLYGLVVIVDGFFIVGFRVIGRASVLVGNCKPRIFAIPGYDLLRLYAPLKCLEKCI